MLASNKPLRVLCAREFQTSLKDSVHKLLCDQVVALGMTQFYDITQATIRGALVTSFFSSSVILSIVTSLQQEMIAGQFADLLRRS